MDCTEIFVETPSSLVLQSEAFSSYKSHTIWKDLFGITPSGAVSFVLSLHCGSISDKEITRCSSIIELLDAEDNIMADKGFIISELLSKKKCNLIIPPFLRCEEQFLEEETEQTKKIARVRIHVERTIEESNNTIYLILLHPCLFRVASAKYGLPVVCRLALEQNYF